MSRVGSGFVDGSFEKGLIELVQSSSFIIENTCWGMWSSRERNHPITAAVSKGKHSEI